MDVPGPELSDEATAARAAAGDQSALEALVLRYQARAAQSVDPPREAVMPTPTDIRPPFTQATAAAKVRAAQGFGLAVE